MPWPCLILVGMVSVISSVVHARLGEDEATLAKRFGAPIKSQKVDAMELEQRTYQNNDLLIGITMIDGRSASEQYLRSTGRSDAEGKPIVAPIAEPLAMAILKANGNDVEWRELEPEAGKRRFLRADNEALALFFISDGIIREIRVSSSAFNRHVFQFAIPKS